ncbi:MAG: histidine--tRNA ligase [Dethiobacter sp.]|nr:histidine--tRNA ligase [Dethiobacter sp.]
MKAPRGTRDILPGEVEKWQFLEGKIKRICRLFGYGEIRTPIFEHTELFLRGVGETTDIVSKEMYTFMDRGERSLTLRPECTASVCRAYMEHKMYGDLQPVKVYYVGPMFRYDRPQAGRYRQFHQFGVEVFGTEDPTVDAEVIALSLVFFRELGLSEFELHINSVGCPECRSSYRGKLQEVLKERVGELCHDCAGRYEKNPLRILDCKSESCRELTEGVPLMVDNLCRECGVHFEEVKKALDVLGEAYVVNPRLVRGLDYYTKTAFEIISPVLGAQSSIGGGGRYDNLMSEIGGPDTPGIGFAIGLERVLLAMEAAGAKLPVGNLVDVFVATAGVPGEIALKLVMELRAAGVAVEKDYMGRSLKAQFKFADKKGARFLVILGEEEIAAGQATVRYMARGEQENVELKNLVRYLSGLVEEA